VFYSCFFCHQVVQKCVLLSLFEGGACARANTGWIAAAEGGSTQC
jgi:hypothetical protein